MIALLRRVAGRRRVGTAASFMNDLSAICLPSVAMVARPVAWRQTARAGPAYVLLHRRINSIGVTRSPPTSWTGPTSASTCSPRGNGRGRRDGSPPAISWTCATMETRRFRDTREEDTCGCLQGDSAGQRQYIRVPWPSPRHSLPLPGCTFTATMTNTARMGNRGARRACGCSPAAGRSSRGRGAVARLCPCCRVDGVRGLG